MFKQIYFTVSCRVYTIHDSLTVFYYFGVSRQKAVILIQGHETHTSALTFLIKKHVILFLFYPYL